MLLHRGRRRDSGVDDREREVLVAALLLVMIALLVIDLMVGRGKDAPFIGGGVFGFVLSGWHTFSQPNIANHPVDVSMFWLAGFFGVVGYLLDGAGRQEPSVVVGARRRAHHWVDRATDIPATMWDAEAMITQSVRYQLPDQGHHLSQLAYDVAGERGAAVVAAEVDRVRRPDGALAQVDLRGFAKAKDGPLHLLSTLLSLEALSVSVWAESGFGMMQKRSARKQVEDLCRTQGADAGTEWALTNGTKKMQTDVLRGMLVNLLGSGSLDADFFRRELGRTFRKWK